MSNLRRKEIALKSYILDKSCFSCNAVCRSSHLLLYTGRNDLDQSRVLLLAEHDADGVIFGFRPNVSVKVVDVHLHLTEVLVR